MPIAAASLVVKPISTAPKNATNTPSCAVAPINIRFGSAISGEKSVIAPTPRNISDG